MPEILEDDVMYDFDVSEVVKPQRVASAVTETVTVTPARSRANETVHRVLPASDWNWSDLRDYIVSQIEARHGAQVRDPKKEAGIVKSFMTRWGTERAVAIAKAAFDVHDGMWRNAPVSINRFCKASDPFFAEPIASNL